MRSRHPKVVHQVAGQEIVRYCLEAAKEAGAGPLMVIVGHGADQVRRCLGETATYIEQREPLGTGHALLQAQPLLEGKAEHLLVLNGDLPLITAATLRLLQERHLKSKAVLSFLTTTLPVPSLGRVSRGPSGGVLRVVEEAEAGEKERGLNELNAGVYCFQAAWLWPHLALLQARRNGEYYLTDLIAIASGEGAVVEGVAAPDPEEGLGVNTRQDLARAEALLRQRLREKWLSQGVSLMDPATTYIDASVEIGQDTILYPNTFLTGATRVGRDCRLGPNTMIRDSTLGDSCRVLASVLEGVVVEEGVEVGPFSHLRPGTYLEAGVHIGSFAEVKESRLGRGTRIGHFSYVGDARIGSRVNIGAGTVTCNFDGRAKHITEIGDGAFIGSDTMLVAPVKIGPGAVTGAGAVVTQDVPPGSLAVGVPAKMKPRKRQAGSEG